VCGSIGMLGPPPKSSLGRVANPAACSLAIATVHNAMLAMGIALSPQLLNSTEIATPAAVYGLFAPVIALALVFIVRRVDPAFKQSEPTAAEAVTADTAAEIT
jgi:hypothetical protein